MLYNISYLQSPTVAAKAQFISFPANKFVQALTYAQNNPQITVFIAINRETKYPDLIGVQEELDNIYYQFETLEYLCEFARTAKKTHYMYAKPIITWGLAQIVKYYKVSDVILGEPLYFQMDAVKAFFKDKGIRTHLNPCPKLEKIYVDIQEPGIRHGWIVPRQVSSYEYAIDVLDIIDPDTLREKTLLNLFTDEKYKNFDENNLELKLKYICPSVGTTAEDIPAAFVDGAWTTHRLNCGQRCLMKDDGCKFCEKQIELYKTYMRWQKL